MLSPLEGALIVEEATSWLGTPYHHRARIKGAGVDCAMFPAEVYAARGLIEPVPELDYPHDWHMHQEAERYLSAVLDRGEETEATDPGNFLLYRWGKLYAHGAIIVRWPTIVHAVLGEGVVLADAGGTQLSARHRRIFTLRAA